MPKIVHFFFSIFLALSLSACFNEVDDSGENGGDSDDTETTQISNVTSFTATGLSEGRIDLSWANPTDASFASVKIRYNKEPGTYPTSVNEGTEAYSGTGTSHSQTGLECGKHYFFTAYSIDSSGNTSSGAQATAPANGVGGCTGGF